TWRGLWRAYGWGLPWAMARRITQRLLQRCRQVRHGDQGDHPSLETAVHAQGGQYLCVQELNGKVCRETLQSWQVDLLILAGAPILRAPILAIPRLGTLNAHHGALPRFRGMNVIEWAVLEGFAPALSVHFVDPGVDTGDIIVTEPVSLYPGDSLETV